MNWSIANWSGAVDGCDVQTSQHRAVSQTLEMVTYPTNTLFHQVGLLVVVISRVADDGHVHGGEEVAASRGLVGTWSTKKG